VAPELAAWATAVMLWPALDAEMTASEVASADAVLGSTPLAMAFCTAFLVADFTAAGSPVAAAASISALSSGVSCAETGPAKTINVMARTRNNTPDFPIDVFMSFP
jgi:hypothetical protein